MIQLLKYVVRFILGRLGYTITRLPRKAVPVPVEVSMMRLIKRTVNFILGGFGYVITRLPKETMSAPVEPPSDASSDETLPKPKAKNPELRSLRINMHHVGGRSGGFPMPFNSKFYDSAEMYIYDADPDCAEQMKSASSYVDHVITAAVGGADGQAVFYVTYDPYTSSLLPPHPEYAAKCSYQDASCDYIMGDVLVPVKTLSVETRSLDSLAREHSFQVDYLSLDVQGAEYELLSGATDSMLRDTVGIMCEFSFLPLYDRQKLFDEIVTLLRPKGFFVANIFPHGYGWATYRPAIGWRGDKGFMAVGDALFMRDPRHIVEHAECPFLSLLKLAFISMCYGNVAYALQCLEEAYKNPEIDVLAAKGEISYVGFLDDMYGLYRKQEHIYPPRFSHLWTAEESLARFKEGAVVSQDKENARRAYFSENNKEVFFRNAPGLLSPLSNVFEELLERYGFSELASLVREKRITSIKQTLGALGIQVVNGSIQQG